MKKRRPSPETVAEFCETAASGAPAKLLALLEAGFDPNARDFRGFPPLAAAAAAGRLDSVQILLDWGSDPNARCGVVDAPVLAWCANRACAKELVAAGADPNALDATGRQVPEAAKAACKNGEAAAAAEAERFGRDLVRAKGAVAAAARRTALSNG